MGRCNNCGKTIDDKYQLCLECNQKIAMSNTLQEIATQLKYINWNLGTIVGLIKEDTTLLKKIDDARKSGNSSD